MQIKAWKKKINKKFKEGDENAFRLLVDKYKNFIFNTSISIIQNTEEADDLTQEVFIQIYKSINKFREKSSLSTWIYRITLSKCYEHLRFKKEKEIFKNH